jgi:ribonuclease T1
MTGKEYISCPFHQTYERLTMKFKYITWLLYFITASTFLSSHAYAAKIPDCGKNGPSKTLPDPKNSEYDAYREARNSAVKGGGNNQIFKNNEGALPSAGKNEVYYEYKLGNDGNNGAGSHRAVLLVGTVSGKNQVLKSYYTQNHYKTFCILP